MKQLLFLFTSLLLIAACNSESSTTGTSGKKPSTVFQKEDVINEVNGGLANSSVDQVDLRNLLQGKKEVVAKPALSIESMKSVFPETLEGMKSEKLRGDQNSIFGYPCTFVSNEYRNSDGTKIVRFAVTDTGGDPKSIVGLAPWGLQVLNKDEKEYYERTRTFGGFPGYERWIHSSQVSNFDYIIDQRWVISLHGRGLPIETIHKIAGSIKPAALRKLK